MRSAAGRIFWAAVLSAMFAAQLSREWDRFVRQNPEGSIWEFVGSLAPLFGQVLAGLTAVGVIVVFFVVVGPRLSKRFGPSETSPPPDEAGPLYAVRTYPLHVAACLLLVGASSVLFFYWPGAAMVAIGLTIAVWVWLGRRMGFGPVDNPAASGNQASS